MAIYAVQMPCLLCELPFITSDVSRNFNHNLLTLTVLLIVMPNLHYTIAAITYFLLIFEIFHLNCDIRPCFGFGRAEHTTGQEIQQKAIAFVWGYSIC